MPAALSADAAVGTLPLTTEIFKLSVHRSAPPTNLVPRRSVPEIFSCSEESEFYSQCIEQMLLEKCSGDETVIEFGSGDGTPVINSLIRNQSAKSRFGGEVHGFELNSAAASIARGLTAQRGLQHTYQVHNSCFFEGVRQLQASHLIGNLPYIPAPDDDILMPALYGGTDGSNLTRDLMSLGFQHAVLLVSAYCDPERTLRHAQQLGYRCTNFRVATLPFGTYSSEPKVRSWIERMKADGHAFCSEASYKLAGVQLQKHPQQQPRSARWSTAAEAEATGSAAAARHGVTALRPHTAEPLVEPDRTDELLAILTAS